jgi:hypothetical protein
VSSHGNKELNLKNPSLWLMVSLGVACISCSSNTANLPAAFAASSTGRNGAYMICYTSSKAHGITVSSVFHVPPVDQVTMLEEPWAKDFRRYVGQSGDAGALSVTCTQVDPKNPEAALKEKIDAWQKQGVRVARVNWKYAG